MTLNCGVKRYSMAIWLLQWLGILLLRELISYSYASEHHVNIWNKKKAQTVSEYNEFMANSAGEID